MNQPLPVSWLGRSNGPRPVPGRSVWPAPAPLENTHALVFARPLRAGTARGPNLIGSWSQCMRKSERGSLSMNLTLNRVESGCFWLKNHIVLAGQLLQQVLFGLGDLLFIFLESLFQ